MESFTDSAPRTFVEEKDYSVACHYRRADADLGNFRTMELKHVLTALLANNSLSVLEGNKVLEVKSSSSVNKGRAAARLTAEDGFDFILSIGDDWTDEYMLEELPYTAHTIKVGTQKTAARYYSKDTTEVRKILERLAN
ncbi:MAG: trehalose-phosphatase [Flavobacterium psychrophilum]|nr:MAG: trehalose-phosphatase [Flavobacterium psychrophilum]